MIQVTLTIITVRIWDLYYWFLNTALSEIAEIRLASSMVTIKVGANNYTLIELCGRVVVFLLSTE